MIFLVFGIISGGIILLGAVGFSMIQKTEGFLHIAHGQFLLLGAYLAYLFSTVMGQPFIFAVVLSTLVTGLIGVACGQYVFAPVRRHGELVLLFTSIGLAYVIEGMAAAAFGSRIKTFGLTPPNVFSAAGTPILTSHEAAVILAAFGSAFGFHLLLKHTNLGKMIRAVSDNLALSQSRGIQTGRVYTFIWFISSAMAAIAGILLGILAPLHIEMGWEQIPLILAATILGGLGSIYGVMAAALVLGLGIELSLFLVASEYRSLIAFGIVIIVLLLRPEGLQSLLPYITRNRVRPG